MNYFIDNEETYLDNIVIPYYKNIQSINSCWAVRNNTHRFLSCSYLFAQQLGMPIEQIIGTSLDQIECWDKQFINLEQTLDSKVLQNTDETYNNVNAMKFNDGTEIPTITIRSPIKYASKVVAIETRYLTIAQNLSFANYKKNSSGLLCGSKNHNHNNSEISERERLIIYLLILRRTQNEIAKLLDVSRARIAQLIGNICEKFNIPGVSAKLLVDYAISHDFHHKMPLELVTLSKL